MKHWLLFLLMAGALAGHSQTFRDGWMVLDGDTLKGQLADNGAIVFFRPDKLKQSESYLKKDLQGYSIGEERYRCTDVDVKNGKFIQHEFLCLELQVRGKCNLWLGIGKDVYGNPWDNFYVEREGYPLILVRNDRSMRKQLYWYFEDHKDLAARIKSGELGFDDLGEIVREFNSWAAGQQAPNP